MFEEQQRVVPIDIQRRPFPVAVRIAAWTWIVVGALLVLYLTGTLALIAYATSRDMEYGMLGVGVCPSLFGFLFLYFGIITLRGSAPGTIWNGIGSLVFGGLFLLIGCGSLAAAANMRRVDTDFGPMTYGFGGFCLAAAAGLLAAAVLAFIGQAGYREWRRLERAARRRARGEWYSELARLHDLPYEAALDDFGDDFEIPVFPWTIQLAAILWIVFGILFVAALLAQVVFLIVNLPTMASTLRPNDIASLRVLLGAAGCFSVIGVVFIVVGVQTLRGTARGSLENGIGSLVFFLINLILTGVLLATRQYISAAVAAVLALGMLAAGVLAIFGCAQYKRWRQLEMPHDEPSRRRVEENRDEE